MAASISQSPDSVQKAVAMLFEEFYEPLQKLERALVEDGEGGFNAKWIDGDEFIGAVVMDKSTTAAVADSAGMDRTYTITTPIGTNLGFYGAVRRLSDGMIFRVTSSPKDITTPSCASFQFEQVKAEAWRLPDE